MSEPSPPHSETTATEPGSSPLLPIFDGHNDVLLRIWDQALDPKGFLDGFEGAIERTPEDDPGGARAPGAGHLDLPRARRGGLCGGFFAIFVPSQRRRRPAARKSSNVDENDAKPTGQKTSGAADKPKNYRFPYPRSIAHEAAVAATREMLALARQLESASAGLFRIVESIEQLDQHLDSWPGEAPARPVAAILHLEGAEAVDKSLANLEQLYEVGVRSIGPVWSRANDFAHGVPFAFPCSPDQGPGLTDAGKALVRSCQELGILVDLAHLNEKGFWDVAKLSRRPLVATHTAAHALTPTARNLTDDQIDAIGQSGGVIGVNLHVADLRADGRWHSDTPLERWATHVAYIAERIGTRCVAVGSDFDGALMPRSLRDASGLQKLLAALHQKGFSASDLRQVASRNWRRVLASAWKSPEDEGDR